MIYLVPVVIFVTVLAGFWLFGRLTREPRVPLARLADPAPLPSESGYGPFPVDTGPLLLEGEHTAAGAALVRDTYEMCQAREREIEEIIRGAKRARMLP